MLVSALRRQHLISAVSKHVQRSAHRMCPSASRAAAASPARCLSSAIAAASREHGAQAHADADAPSGKMAAPRDFSAPPSSSSSSSPFTPSTNTAASMLHRQLAIEEEVRQQALTDHSKSMTELMQMGRGTGLKTVQRVFLQWYEPFVDEIREEIKLVKARNTDNGRGQYGPYLLLLPPEKLAIITINMVMNSILRSHNQGAVVTRLADELSNTVQTEFVATMKLSQHKKSVFGPQAGAGSGAEGAAADTGATADPTASTSSSTLASPSPTAQETWRTEMVKQLLEGGSVTHTVLLKIKRLMDEPDWPRDVKFRLGSALIALLLQTAKYSPGGVAAEGVGAGGGVGAADGSLPSGQQPASAMPDGDQLFSSAASLPALIHSTDFGSGSSSKKRIGLVRLDPFLYDSIANRGQPSAAAAQAHAQSSSPQVPPAAAPPLPQEDVSPMLIRYLPMVTPPQPWDNFKADQSPYLTLRAEMIRTFSKAQKAAVRRCAMDSVIESLNFINSTPWRVNKPVLHVIQDVWSRNMAIGELPDLMNTPFPAPSAAATQQQQQSPAESIPNAEQKQEQEVEYNERLYKRMCKQIEQKNSELHSMRCDMRLKLWVAEKFADETAIYFPHNLDFRGRAYPIPPNLNHISSDLCRALLVFSEAKPLGRQGFDWLKVHLSNLFGHNKVSRELRVEWVDEQIEEVIDSARDPVHGRRWWASAENPFQALATCREILKALEFAHPERSVEPAEDPAAVIPAAELAALNSSPNPASVERLQQYPCHLPVHQDGSCNGLQHYAALGRDYDGGCAVNLVNRNNESGRAHKPADVYSEVLTIVKRRIASDQQLPTRAAVEAQEWEKLRRRRAAEREAAMASGSALDGEEAAWQTLTQTFAAGGGGGNDTANATEPDCIELSKEQKDLVLRGEMARLVASVVNRKVIKQTVMTSVYGVTKVGARLQVERQLEGLLFGGDPTTMSEEESRQLFQAARYVSNLALDSLGEMFTGAKMIMDWLAKCAELVAGQGQSMSWMTPLGLPVMQPYRKTTKHTVKTILQSVILAVNDDSLPVSTQRQRSAFPPNFVHSLDATHMMLTSLQMKELGLTFASVHDSYWTHACDVPVLSEALRASFIELYSLPILEDLRDSLARRHPDVKFPPVPQRGELNINQVWDSSYFFH